MPATYNMHGWGAMVTLVTLKNPYTEKELDKLAEDYEKLKDETSVAITRAAEKEYLKEFNSRRLCEIVEYCCNLSKNVVVLI